MGFNLRPYGKILNKMMYNDVCSISRPGTNEDIYGATHSTNYEIIYNDVPCKFSFSQKDVPGDEVDVYIPAVKQVMDFMDLDYEIKAGDIFSGYRKDASSGIDEPINGICGMANRFDTHQQIAIELKGEN